VSNDQRISELLGLKIKREKVKTDCENYFPIKKELALKHMSTANLKSAAMIALVIKASVSVVWSV